MPDVGRPAQSFEPPPQFGIPDDPMRDAPIMRITVPIKIINVSNYLMCQGRRTEYEEQIEWSKTYP